MSVHFLTGLNPYGLTYTLGLQGTGTPLANPSPGGLEGFIAIARGIGARSLEFDHRWLAPMTDRELRQLRDQIGGMIPVCSFWLSQTPGETLAEAIRCAGALGATVIRLHLTPVLAGARAAHGARWDEWIQHAERTVVGEAPRAARAGLTIALENHQDFGSEELVALAEKAGENVGITLDTGNPFAVGEDPVAFTTRAAHRVRHVHFKDYRAQFTDEGYKLVRCAIGEGCVPFDEMVGVLGSHHDSLTASLEPGALEARHVRAFSTDWWNRYGSRDAAEFAIAIGRLRRQRFDDDADVRTPWEREAVGAEVAQYEQDQMRRSVAFVRAKGWL